MTGASGTCELPGSVMTKLIQALSDGSCQTMDELAERLPLTRKQITQGATKLILRDYAERVEKGCYRLTPAGRRALDSGESIIAAEPNARRPPRRHTFRQRLWNAMRMSGTFTAGDLIMAARGPRDDYPEQNAASYISRLRRAGYLMEMARRVPGTAPTSRGHKQYRLVRNTGPVAPVWNAKLRAFRDHNSGEDVPCK